mmetsp:Transcript_25315/g.58680  ORF Transcript_25315/g.58680 Transcript_25315/m.58680 type:complete len:209 (+) Transcript_25315:824-1450(+)
MNSMTMPPWLSITCDMSLKYRLRRTSDLSGGSFSTMVVKDAMSEKNIVTSIVPILSDESIPAARRICTTGHGTYFPQDRIAVFVLSKMLSIRRISATPRSKFTTTLAPSRPASCICVTLCMSSARRRIGPRRLDERALISLVKAKMPTMMMMMAVVVTMMENTAFPSCKCLTFKRAMDVTLISPSEPAPWVSKGTRTRTTSFCRWMDF